MLNGYMFVSSINLLASIYKKRQKTLTILRLVLFLQFLGMVAGKRTETF